MENLELLEGILISDYEIVINDFGGSQVSGNIIIEENVDDAVANDLENLKSLLKEFNLMQLLPALQTSNVTYRCLQYIQKDDLIEAIPHLGLRVEFREKLFKWRKKEFGIDDETISNPSKVYDWMNKDFPNVPSPSSSSCSIRRVLNKIRYNVNNMRTYKYMTMVPFTHNLDLLDILKQTSKGQSCLDMYKESKILTDSKRDDIINIIIEKIICNKVSVKPNDFLGIVADICEIFPSKKTFYKFFYI